MPKEIRWHNYAVWSRRNSWLLFSAITYLFLVFPLGAQNLVTCPIYRIFGFYCPGCGSSRALKALFSLDPVSAIHQNVLFVFSPFLILIGLYCKRNNPKLLYSVYIPALVLLVVGFTIARNMPNSPLAPF